MAAMPDLILVATVHHAMPHGRLGPLRQALAPRSIVALLVDDHVGAIERALIRSLLYRGTIPLILTHLDPPPTVITTWLDREPPDAHRQTIDQQ